MDILLVFLVCPELEQGSQNQKMLLLFWKSSVHVICVALQGFIKIAAVSSSLPYRKGKKKSCCISLILYQIKIMKTEIQSIDFFFFNCI